MRKKRDFNKPENNPFAQMKAFIPKETEQFLREKAKESGLPMSRLIAIAIDNERDSPVPFNFPCLIPSVGFIQYAFLEEAQKLIRYLSKFPSGASRDLLMLCRRDMGIPNRNDFMLAYRECLEAKMIEEVNPPIRAKFKYQSEYKYTRIVKI